MLAAVHHLRYKGGNTFTGLALTHVLEQNLKPAAGVRPEAAKVLILVTDGKSQDDVRTAARILKDQDIDVFVVGEPAQCLGPGFECTWLGWTLDHRHICTLALPSLARNLGT